MTDTVKPTSKNNLPSEDKKKSCMPENPFLPDSLFGTNSDKIKAHIGIFLAFIVGLRLVRMFTNLETPSSRHGSLKHKKI